MTFPEVSVSLLGVLVGMFVVQVIGHAWYGALFAKAWQKYMKITPAQVAAAKKKGMGKTIAVGFLSSFVMMFVLAHFLAYADAVSFSDVVGTVFWLWLGFMMPLQLGKVLYEGRPIGFFLLNTAYDFVALILGGYALLLVS
jgi:hypothetical protein